MPEPEASREDLNKRIQWQLKCIANEFGNMSESDQEWSTKMEEAFLEQGFLTVKQQACLDRIYKKYS